MFKFAYKYSDGTIVYIDSPYYTYQSEKLGKKEFYSLEEILSLGYSKTKNTKIQKCKETSFVELSKMGCCIGGDHPGWYYYGVIRVSSGQKNQMDELSKLKQEKDTCILELKNNPIYAKLKQIEKDIVRLTKETKYAK